MGHRALVAYERIDGTYNLHYTHWGGLNLRLRHTITDATPFGSDRPTKAGADIYADLTSGVAPERVQEEFDLADCANAEVEPLPQVADVTLTEAITDHLDYLIHEAFYVVDREFEVTAYRTLWFGLQYEATCVEDSPTVGHGALQPTCWHEGEPVGDGFTRGQFAGMKQVVGEMIDRGMFDREAALQYLQGKLFATTDDEVRVSLAV
ncbi:DUF6735 family protein [Haloglomus litoreum]|uniref:DUF6735 family protein n=1 Tax=Haloglomus litoreum TaxID=3034026 RepID=UPI0023E8EBCB|nr:DUF6735 family protein [Haloglomus sp. DT116]